MAEYAIREKTEYTVVRTHQVDGEVGPDEVLGTFDSVHKARGFINAQVEKDEAFLPGDDGFVGVCGDGVPSAVGNIARSLKPLPEIERESAWFVERAKKAFPGVKIIGQALDLNTAYAVGFKFGEKKAGVYTEAPSPDTFSVRKMTEAEREAWVRKVFCEVANSLGLPTPQDAPD